MPEKANLGNFAQTYRKFFTMVAATATIQEMDVDLGLSTRDLVACVVHKYRIIEDIITGSNDQNCAFTYILSGRSLDGMALGDGILNAASSYSVVHSSRTLTTSGFSLVNDLEVDFGNLPGGGLIIPARPIFFDMIHANLGANMGIAFEMQYSLKALDQATMLDLIQTMLGVGLGV